MEKQAKSVLFLPFLQIPSGHHQAANAIIEGLMEKDEDIQCEKVDILSYSYGRMESLISSVYLKWIHAFPGIYNALYQNSVYKNLAEDKRFHLYEFLFLAFMRRLISERKPDLIVCTHALPAYMINLLKKRMVLDVPAINVYTDYFVHRFWGVQHIDYHFVPSEGVKNFLTQKGVSEKNIYITGIPVHSKLITHIPAPNDERSPSVSVLVAGGSMGAGGMEGLVSKICKTSANGLVRFYILCGKNQPLYEKLKRLNKQNIIPFPYISSMEEMNSLYDRIDAVITKPGGVTISECLHKRKPIFIYDALPGQERINLMQLKGLGLVFKLDKENIQGHILSVLQNQNEMDQYQSHITRFHQQLCTEKPSDILGALLKDQGKFQDSPAYS